MSLWQRASGALKDQKAIVTATLSRRRSHRNPDLETAIIKATSHNESFVDYRNAQRVFAWIHTSPVSLKPLIWALTIRMEKTHSWVVALKGLMLIHGVFCLKTPSVLRIGNLPFDLSNFAHRHSRPIHIMWGFNAFIRSYYTYLDRRSSLLYGRSSQIENGIAADVIKLENLQSLLDILLQIKPAADNMRVNLILEAMDCVLIEIFDVYSRIHNVIANILMGIYSAGKAEAAMALKVLQKAITQSEDLDRYFEFCKEFGVFNAMEIPKVTRIPEEEIRDVERLINESVSERKNNLEIHNENKNVAAIVEEKGQKISRLKTIITDKWEVFDEENHNHNHHLNDQGYDFKTSTSNELGNPYEIETPPLISLPLLPVYKHDQIPDFISFY